MVYANSMSQSRAFSFIDLLSRHLQTHWRRLFPAILTSVLTLPAHAQVVGSAQLSLSVEAGIGTLNGQPISLQLPPRNIGGRIMLPLRETLQLLGQPFTDGFPLSIGQMTIDNQLNVAFPSEQAKGGVVSVDGTLYISARLLAEALGGYLSLDSSGKVMTLTAVRGGGNPLLPQARFSTDKQVYAPGEKIIYTEYSFDPDGTDITSRRWNGKEDAFFREGTYQISLQVTNSRGARSTPTTRTIQVEGTAIDTPLSYALKYAETGESFVDNNILSYPALPLQPVYTESFPLIFSDSPEAPTTSGILYQDSLKGRARLLAYHLNNLGKPARLYITARNTDNFPIDITTERMGETAPTRIESQLGQATLLEYFAHTGQHSLHLEPGEQAALYASPTLSNGAGVNVLQEIVSSGQVELTFAMLEETWPPTIQVLQQVPYLPSDGKHQRGTFPNAVRKMRTMLSALPARLIIGDGSLDPALEGIDKLTGQPQRLSGNYGVLYDLEIYGARNTAIAFSPRGGLYRGAMHIEDGALNQTIKLPRIGNALLPDQPVLLWRPTSDRLNIDFIPASGSNLPISLIFYRGAASNQYGLHKTYQP